MKPSFCFSSCSLADSVCSANLEGPSLRQDYFYLGDEFVECCFFLVGFADECAVDFVLEISLPVVFYVVERWVVERDLYFLNGDVCTSRSWISYY